MDRTCRLNGVYRKYILIKCLRSIARIRGPGVPDDHFVYVRYMVTKNKCRRWGTFWNKSILPYYRIIDLMDFTATEKVISFFGDLKESHEILTFIFGGLSIFIGFLLKHKKKNASESSSTTNHYHNCIFVTTNAPSTNDKSSLSTGKDITAKSTTKKKGRNKRR